MVPLGIDELVPAARVQVAVRVLVVVVEVRAVVVRERLGRAFGRGDVDAARSACSDRSANPSVSASCDCSVSTVIRRIASCSGIPDAAWPAYRGPGTSR